MNYKLISSYLFFINVYVCYNKKYYIYTILFINLLISSVIYHWIEYDLYDNIENINIIKKIYKINENLIIIYALFIFLYKNFKNKRSIFYNGMIIYLFLFSIYLWFYGFYKKKYCFDTNKEVSSKYHSFIHLLAVIDHLLIVL